MLFVLGLVVCFFVYVGLSAVLRQAAAREHYERQRADDAQARLDEIEEQMHDDGDEEVEEL